MKNNIKISFVIVIALLIVALAINLVSATSSVLISDQGTDLKNKSTGQLLQSGNLVITLYDSPTDGNLIFNQSFPNAIANGSWNLMLSPSLEFGKTYWKDYMINGENINFDGNDRISFQSSLGLMNNASFINFSLINSCSEGSSIRLIHEDGTVECQTDNFGNSSGSVDLANYALKNQSETFDGNISTAQTGFFGWLGNAIQRITKLFVKDIDVSGDIAVAGNVTASHFIGDGSQLTNLPSNGNQNETDPIFSSQNSTIWSSINNKLEESDQRYNDTNLINNLNSSLSSRIDNISLTPGPQGPAGANGTNGINGINGLNGSQGPQGIQGIQGPAGANGTNGINGINGLNGSQGPQGIQGIQGPAGANGTNGINGINGLNGSQGPQGIQGIQGPAGANGTNGINGINGLNGSQGPQGIQGIQGPAGANGTNGINGINGLNGSQGPQGIQGIQGPAGANGTNGINGINGLNGSQGPQGIQGIQGPAGANGTNGINGINGLNGSQGPQGIQGIQGPAGANGTNGINGINGLNGSQGPQGIQGIQGPAGANGTNGINGINGLNGSQGPQGIQGIPGINGTNGKDGVNGTFTDIINSTQMSNSGGVLTILESWLKNLFYTKSEIDSKSISWNSTYNSTYAQYAYNQTTPSSGSYNSTYAQYAYNQTYSGSTYNATYATNIANNSWNESRANLLYSGIQWGYNMTSQFTNWLTTFVYNYNQTAPAITYASNINTTLSSRMDGLSPGNSSFNQTLTDSIYSDKKWNYNQTYSGSTYNSSYDAGIQWNYNQTLATQNTFGTWGINATTLAISNITGTTSSTACTGTNKVTQVTITNGVLSTTCAADQTGGSTTSTYPFDNFRVISYAKPISFATTFTAVGFPAITPIGTATSVVTTDQAGGIANTSTVFINYAQAAATTMTGAGVYTANETTFSMLPRLLTQVQETDLLPQNRSVWIALEGSVGTAGLLTLNGTHTSGVPPYVGVRYCQNQSGTFCNDANWQCCSGNGTKGSCIDTGVKVYTNFTYGIEIDVLNLTTLECHINNQTTDTFVYKTDLLPSIPATMNQQMIIRNEMTTLTAAVRYHRISWLYLGKS